MRKLKLSITTGTAEDFFRRGQDLARKLDRGGKISAAKIVSFKNPSDISMEEEQWLEENKEAIRAHNLRIERCGVFGASKKRF